MQAVILAAGQGRRLARMGWDKPKCLLPVGGETLLDRMLSSLHEYDITETVIVLGYRRELVESHLMKRSLNCVVVVNHDFAQTNTIHSLWLTREYLAEGFLYFNSDLFFDRRILGLILSSPDSAAAVDVRICGAEEVKVLVDGNQRITEIGKELPTERCWGESIGMVKFLQPACAAMIASLERFNAGASTRRLYFESALNEILADLLFRAVPLGDLRAVEVDTPQDYEAALRLAESGVVR